MPHSFLVGGEWRTTSRVLEVHFPYNNEVTECVCLAGDEDCEDAMKAALSGFRKMRLMPAYERATILERMASGIAHSADELAECLVRECGKTRLLAGIEVMRAAETLRISAGEATRTEGEIIPLDSTEHGEGRTGFLKRVPAGPVLCITPFNFPLNLACHKIGPAIAAGNSFILKPASKTPLSAIILGRIALEAGMPPEAVSVLPCEATLAERLVRDHRIAVLSFTGSPDVGWHLRAIAGQKRVALELGGNAAVIVHEDADLEKAAARIAEGGCMNAGQVCISVQRVFLQNSIYNRCLEMIADRMKSLRTGDPRDPETEIGPMISEEAAETAEKKVTAAVRGGAEVVTGGRRSGTLFEPTLLVATTPDMAVNRNEVFAPIITVTPYETFTEAISRANNSEYGLQMGIFTDDMNRIMEAFGSAEVGGLIINDIPSFRTDPMPYGGVKLSGMGREGPRHAIEEMTERRFMVI